MKNYQSIRNINKLLKHFGSISTLANALSISRLAVYQWKDYVPTLRAYQIETVTKGKLKAKWFLPSKRKVTHKA